MSYQSTGKSTVYVDGAQAEQELKRLAADVEKYTKAMEKAKKANDNAGFEEAKKKMQDSEKEYKSFKNTVYDVTKVLNNLSGSSYNELVKAQKQLRKEVKDMTKNTQEEINAYKQKLAVLGKLDNAVEKSRKEMGWFRQSSTQLVGTLKRVGAALGFTGVLYSVANMFNFAKNASNDFGESVSNLSAMTGLTGKELDDLAQKAKDFSGSTTAAGIRITKSAKDIVDGYILMGSARPELLKNADALDKVTRSAIELSVAQKMDLSEAVKAVAASMNQFDLGASQSTRIINALAAGSLKGSAFVQDLTDSMKNVGTVAAGANMSLEQTIAMLEVFGAKQLKGEEAGTQMRSAILRLQAAGVGYEHGLFNLGDALDEVNKKLSLLSTAQEKDALVQQIFGKRQITAGKIMLQNVDAYNKMTKAVSGTNVAMDQAAKNTDNVKAKLAQNKQIITNVAIEFGQKLNPALITGSNTLVVLARVLASTAGFLIDNGRIILSAAAGIAAYTIAVKAASAIQKIYTTATEIATIATNGFNAAIKSNGIAALFGLIATGVTALITWKSTTKEATTQQADFNTELEKTGKLLGKQLYQNILDDLFQNDFGATAEERLNKVNEILKNKAMQLNKTQLEAMKQYVTGEIANITRILNNVPNMEKDLQGPTLQVYQPSLNSMQKSLAIINTELAKFDNLSSGSAGTNTIKAQKEQVEKLTSQLKKLEDAKENINLSDKKALETNQKQIDKTKSQIEALKKIIAIELQSGDSFTQVERDKMQMFGSDLQKKLAGIDEQARKYKQDGVSEVEITKWVLKQKSEAIKEFNDKIAAETNAKNKELFNQLWQQKQVFINLELEDNENQYKAGLLSEGEYQQQKYAIQLSSLMAEKALMEQFGIDTTNIDKQIIDKKAEYYKQDKKNYENIEKKKTDITTDEDRKRQENDAKALKLQEKRQREALLMFSQLENSLSGVIQAAIAGNQDALKQAEENMIMLLLDFLKIEVEMAIAKATIESLAQPDSIATLGATGFARAAVMVTLIEGVFAGIKGLVARAFNSKPSTQSSPVQTTQYAKGNFLQVTGADDGRKYNAKIAPGKTGIYNRPTLIPGLGLVGEVPGQKELVLSGPETQKVLNSPGLVEALKMTLGYAPVKQYASGNAREIIRENTIRQSFTDPELLALLKKLDKKLDQPSRSFLIPDENYLRTHKKAMDKYDSFQGTVG